IMLACQDPTERAVSPVVGVMLMLVVTIIIAAIVTAFAGGITQTGDKTPQATLTGQFSQSSGLEMVHSGGDTLTTTNLQVIVRESDNFGNARGYLTPWVINGTFIQNSQGLYWQNATDGSIPVLAWHPGQTMYVNVSDWNTMSTFEHPTSTETSLFSTSNLGNNLILEVSYADGKLISKSTIPIVP
ncbi:type IV pilin N-terminal domain-containing protein, partial [Methanoregula sp.]|uniref:type IV pilin N-terminal domain-containing protein n=2 Tax=Methanoregula sp. TaxID=2052170 RepID=UPI003BAFD01A